MQGKIARILFKLGGSGLIAAILLSVVIPARQMARYAESHSRMRNLADATVIYTAANDGKLPPLENMEVARQSLTPHIGRTDATWWEVPGHAGLQYQPNPTLSRKRLSDIKNRESMVLFFEPVVPWTYSRKFAIFADGTGRSVEAKDWPEVARKSGITLPRETEKPIWSDIAVLEITATLSLETLAIGLALWLASLLTRKR